MRGKTVVVIAHRLSTIMRMDRIVVVEKGRIIAEGTHRELLEAGGLYKRLWSIQAGGFLAGPELKSSDGGGIENANEDESDEKETTAVPKTK